MKRFFALVVMIAMLITPAAAGEEAKNARGAGKFTPSVSGKPAPEIVPGIAPDGSFFAGIIRNLEKAWEIFVSEGESFLVTALGQLGLLDNEEVRNRLEAAYKAILEAENVGKLFAVPAPDAQPTDEPEFIADQLDKRLMEMNADLTHEDLVVKDLFDVNVKGEYQDFLKDENSKMEVSFMAAVEEEDPFVAISSEDGVHWQVFSAEDAIVNENGSVTMQMQSSGVVAFLVESEEEWNAETAVQSPN